MPTASNHPLAQNTNQNPAEFASPNTWDDIQMIDWMTYQQNRLLALENISFGLLTDAPNQSGGAFARLAALEAGSGASRFENFTTMPAFTPGVITYPTGVTANHQYDLSIVSGKLRVTGNASNTSNNLRIAYGLTSAGLMGDSEVRWTLAGSSVDFDTIGDRVQIGSVHRYTRTRETLQGATVAAAVGAATIDGTGWTSAQFVGALASYRECWVQIVDGPGTGQKRRIISNTTTRLTLASNWSTTSPEVIPTTSSKFEIYTYRVRALSVVMGNMAGGGHAWVQPNIWDNGSYRQPGVGQTDLGAYLDPIGGFSTFKAFPHHVKCRVRGNTVDMAIWAASDPECAYGTTNQSASWTLAAGNDAGYADEPGMCGLYVAHLNAGDTVDFDDLTVSKL